MSTKPSLIASIVLATAAISVAAPASASLIADGLTYTLLESTVSGTNGLEDQFTLEISGINGPGDTEGGGRYGVGSLALTQPVTKGVSTGSLTGFTFMMGGLNAMGCNGSGNFYCFLANAQPTAPALPSNSTLTFVFFVTAKSASDWTGYDPTFKIDWIGTRNTYDLVSKTLTPAVVPLPATLLLFLSGLAALGLTSRGKSRALRPA